MPRQTPPIPTWIRQFSYPGYANVYSLDRLTGEQKLFGTETLFGDWDAPSLFYAKDAVPANVIRGLIQAGDPDPWRHAEKRRDRTAYRTNERVVELAEYFHGTKLYGSALAHMLKEGDDTSGPLKDFTSGPLHDHLQRVLNFVVQNMPNLQVIVCLGNESHGLVSSCTGSYDAAILPVGKYVDVDLFNRRVLLGRLYHPSRAFKGGWDARRQEWKAVAEQANVRIAEAERLTSARG